MESEKEEEGWGEDGESGGAERKVLYPYWKFSDDLGIS